MPGKVRMSGRLGIHPSKRGGGSRRRTSLCQSDECEVARLARHSIPVFAWASHQGTYRISGRLARLGAHYYAMLGAAGLGFGFPS